MHITHTSMLYYVVVMLIIGNVFALIIGVLMLTAPSRLSALSKFSNRWISTRKLTRPRAKSPASGRVILRYPRVLGVILLASAALILVKGAIFVTGMNAADGGRLLALLYRDANVSISVWENLWVGLVAFIMLGAVMAILVGLMSLFKIGKLKHWAESINRGVSARRATKPLDVPHYHLDKQVAARPHVWGGVITALALFSVVVLWVFVLGA